MGRSKTGISWDAADGDQVHLLFLIVSGEKDPDQHVLLLAEIARTMRDRALMRLILTARSPAEMWRLLVTRGYGEETTDRSQRRPPRCASRGCSSLTLCPSPRR